MPQTTVSIKRLSIPTIYKIVFIGTMFSLVPLGSLMGILAFFGMNTVSWNESQIYGFWGLIAGVFIGVLLSLFMTIFLGTASAIGCWIYSKFDPIRISYFHSPNTPAVPESEAEAASGSSA